MVGKIKKHWKGCKHEKARKLAYRENRKWMTTDFLYCKECDTLIKQEVKKEVVAQ